MDEETVLAGNASSRQPDANFFRNDSECNEVEELNKDLNADGPDLWHSKRQIFKIVLRWLICW